MAQYLFATFALVMLVPFVCSLPLQNVGRDVKSDMILLSRINNLILSNTNIVNKRRDLPMGEALDLFYRYGFFSLSVRVVPRDDSGSWLIREPTAAVFEESTVQEQVRKIGNSAFDSEFQIFLCDDESELMEAFFRDFAAEGVDQPYKLFTGSWHKNTKSKYLGLSKEVLDGDSSFVLVKLNKKKVVHSITNPVSMILKPNAQASVRSIQVANPDSVKDFVSTYGSHYIQDVVVGDTIYQVFALPKDQYEQAKRSVNGQQRLNSFRAFYDDHLAPWKVREAGQIQVASGDKQVKSFLELNLKEQGQFGSSPNIFKVEENTNLLTQLEALTADTEAVIGMNFASLRNWVPDLLSRDYYDAIVGTQASLWAANL